MQENSQMPGVIDMEGIYLCMIVCTGGRIVETMVHLKSLINYIQKCTFRWCFLKMVQVSARFLICV